MFFVEKCALLKNFHHFALKYYNFNPFQDLPSTIASLTRLQAVPDGVFWFSQVPVRPATALS